MATLIIKNNTAFDQPIADQGTFVPASGQIDITDRTNLLDMASSASLRALTVAATVTLNDGSSDLSILDAISYLDNLWASSGSSKFGPLSSGFLSGARLNWISTSVVSVGTALELSLCAGSQNALPIAWVGILTADITVAGAGGLQTGQAEAADTWYQVLVIGDTSGVNPPAALLVPAGVAFSQAGYDIFRRVGYVRNDGSSNFLNFFQSGKGTERTILYEETVPTLRVLNNGSAISFTDVDCSAFIPPIGRAEIMLQLTFDNSGGAAGNDLRVRPKGSTLTNVPTRLQPGVLTVTSMQIPVRVFTDASQVIQYQVSVAADVADIIVSGYRDDL